MISPKYFIEQLKRSGIEFFTGVPDSLLKNICAYITDNNSIDNNIIAANEGGAVGLAAGYYLATQKIPVVYMQNSGIGNAVNPLMSLMDKDVYNIPVLLLIGWRGEPGIKDEPQHIKQGKITIPLLDSMGIENTILAKHEATFTQQLEFAIEYMKTTKAPYAFVIQKETFDDYKLQDKEKSLLMLEREEAIRLIATSLKENDIVVSTTGMISRELFEYRENTCQSHERDFLTVGSMGHASQIALGIALNKKNRRVYCFDGDGATIMHLGSLAIVGDLKPNNYIHIIFNNGAHDSVGGQPTVGFNIDLKNISLSCGYKGALSVDDSSSLNDVLNNIDQIECPFLLEVKVKKGARKDLGRPTTTPIQNKEAFMTFLQK